MSFRMDERRRRIFNFSLGQRPRVSKTEKRTVLKARFIPRHLSRAFSAKPLPISNPGALPQASNDNALTALIS